MISVALTILGPLAAAAAILIFRRLAAPLALLGAGVGLVSAAATLAAVAGGARYSAELPGLPEFPLRLVAEPLTAALATVVAVVSALVMIYAVGYMAEEEGKPRFYAGMSFFAVAMQTLMLAGDWVLLLAAWELIGLSSYLLIGFWFWREEVPQSATRAFLYTRTADLGLYVAIFALISQTGTSGISRTLEAGGATATVAGLLLLVAAAGKSAQTPLHGWLQDAMVGPTPVSALLHSATLVAAGAILMIRTSPLLPPTVLVVAGVLGGATALVAGTIAVAEGDIKRLLAASTSSQYGFMLLAVGAGSPVAALIHLTAHAAMKSSLFLGAGVFQHARGSTSFDHLGGVGRGRRWTFAGFAVAGLALAGIPPLSGFWTKDAILAASLESPYAALFLPLALVGTLLTAVYVARALRLLWHGEGRSGQVAGIGWMGTGLASLVVLAVVLGIALEPLARLVGEELPADTLTVLLGLAAAVAGLALGWLVPAGRLLGPAREAAAAGFRIGGGFDGIVARPALSLARAVARFDDTVIHSAVLAVGRGALTIASVVRTTDERGIDGLISALVVNTRELGGRARELQSGLIHKELMLAAVGVALIFVMLMVGL